MRRLFTLLALLFAPPAYAESNMKTFVERIDYLVATDRHQTSRVWQGRFTALNGDAFDLERFYHSQRPQLNMLIGFRLRETATTRVILPLHFDNGYKAELYEAQRYVGLGLVTQWAKSDMLHFGLHLHDIIQLGGKVSERPCYDDFRRRFHCGTGLPWTDADPYLGSREVSPRVKFTLNWRF